MAFFKEESFKNGQSNLYFLKNDWSSKRETVVFLHGFPDGPEVWCELALEIGQYFNIIIPYLPGVHPKFKMSSEIGRSFQLSVLLLIRSRKEMCRGVHLVGHDVGGVLVDQLSYMLGDHCKSLSFISTMGLNLYSKNLKIDQIVKSWYIPLFSTSVGQKLMLKNLNIGKKFLKKMDESVVESKIPDRLGSIKLYREFVNLLVAPTRWDRINNHRSLFVFSTKDPFVKIPEQKNVRQYYNNSTVRVIDGGHWEFIHQKEKYAEILKNHLLNEGGEYEYLEI